jgi:hypothetical protein
VRQVLPFAETDALRCIVEAQAKHNAYPPSLEYLTPGKYTVSGNKMADHPGLAPIVEHPGIVDRVECLLGQPAYLTAYVAYVRTPGDNGSGPHNDYKRWRPVGSSMDWLFAIVPLTDFNAEYGPLLVAPGSHKLHQVNNDAGAAVLDVTRPDRDQLPAFIDPELKAGDLLLLNMYTWHEAPAGTSVKNRCGIFNKYCAVNAPPAAGYYSYNQAAYHSLSETGKRLIPVHFDKPIATTRLLIERPSDQESVFLVLEDPETKRWQLPGSKGWEEEQGVGWDVGARIGSLQTLTQTQLGLGIPWMSYIEDIEEENGVCRVYGFVEAERSYDPLPTDAIRCEWYTMDQLLQILGESDYICRAIHTWQRDDIVRGRGKACSQIKQQYD